MSLAKMRPVADRFWEKVDKSAGEDGCWIWTGAAIDGYGKFAVTPKDVRKAHRVSLWLHGIIPDPKGDQRGHVADHICRNRSCVNPKHLRIVPARQNATENSSSPIAANAKKTACSKGHPFTGENVAHLLIPLKKNSRGNPTDRIGRQRVCLTCFPHYRNNRYRVFDDANLFPEGSV